MYKDNFEVINLKTRYASQSLNEIPIGTWIDKSVGGCGLSYLCLNETNDSIILMPRTKLIKNKLSQKNKYSNLFGIFSGVGKKHIKEYIESVREINKPVKILITYDSFAMGKLDYLLEENPECRIYVDESQFLIEFAQRSPNLVNELHKRFKNNIHRTTFFSAHPPKREYLPEYIQNMKGIKYTWLNQVKATPYVINTSKPYYAVNKLLKDIINKGECIINDKKGNELLRFKKAIVFVNSVEGIRKIAEELKSPTNIAYVVGDTVRNDMKLNDFAYSLEECDKLPLITIGTTSLISGYDLYDEETLNIVISISNREYTLLDKELDVPQAITRQRLDSNPNNSKFIFIINRNNMQKRIDTLEETYKNDHTKLTKVVDNLNYLKEGGKDYTIGFELYEGYYYMENEIFYVNESLLKARKYIFEQLYKQYLNGYNVISTQKPKDVIIDLEGFKPTQYSDFVLQIKECETNEERFEIIRTIGNENWKKYLQYAVETDNLLINMTAAKEHYENKKTYDVLKEIVHNTFKIDNFYTNSKIKEELTKIYKNKNLNRVVKSTDLYEFFEIKNSSKYINKIKVQGFTIISKKL